MTQVVQWVDKEKSITCATAICKAASMIENLDVVVDMRSTLNSGSGYSRRASNYYPLVVVVYDSRVDKFIKVKKHFPSLSSSGTTPEGLCFEAIMSDMVESNRGIDSYFLNFSDGMPCTLTTKLTIVVLKQSTD